MALSGWYNPHQWAEPAPRRWCWFPWHWDDCVDSFCRGPDDKSESTWVSRHNRHNFLITTRDRLLTLYPVTSDSFSRALTRSQFNIILESDVFHITLAGGWLGAEEEEEEGKQHYSPKIKDDPCVDNKQLNQILAWLFGSDIDSVAWRSCSSGVIRPH